MRCGPSRELYLTVMDDDAKRVSIHGPMQSTAAWISGVLAAWRVGRHVRCLASSTEISSREDLVAHWSEAGYRESAAPILYPIFD